MRGRGQVIPLSVAWDTTSEPDTCHNCPESSIATALRAAQQPSQSVHTGSTWPLSSRQYMPARFSCAPAEAFPPRVATKATARASPSMFPSAVQRTAGVELLRRGHEGAAHMS